MSLSKVYLGSILELTLELHFVTSVSLLMAITSNPWGTAVAHASLLLSLYYPIHIFVPQGITATSALDLVGVWLRVASVHPRGIRACCLTEVYLGSKLHSQFVTCRS